MGISDNELLQLSAKAAGLDFLVPEPSYNGSLGLVLCDELKRPIDDWNPLKDDGDALRLAVKLGIDLELHGALVDFKFICATANKAEIQCEETDEDVDIEAATRRAIVRAAAEIGKS